MKTTRGAATAAVLAVSIAAAPLALATPENPHGDDWVALAVSLSANKGGYGTSGTQDGAQNIALAECGKQAPDCTVAEVLEYGCTYYAINTATGELATGHGPTAEAATDAATLKMQPYQQGEVRGFPKCSTPISPP